MVYIFLKIKKIIFISVLIAYKRGLRKTYVRYIFKIYRLLFIFKTQKVHSFSIALNLL